MSCQYDQHPKDKAHLQVSYRGQCKNTDDGSSDVTPRLLQHSVSRSARHQHQKNAACSKYCCKNDSSERQNGQFHPLSERATLAPD